MNSLGECMERERAQDRPQEPWITPTGRSGGTSQGDCGWGRGAGEEPGGPGVLQAQGRISQL